MSIKNFIKKLMSKPEPVSLVLHTPEQIEAKIQEAKDKLGERWILHPNFKFTRNDPRKYKGPRYVQQLNRWLKAQGRL